MLTIALIAFREFLEAALLIGVFIGLDRKLELKKRKEIILASLTGIIFSLILPLLVFFFANEVKTVINEKTSELLEGYLLTFSGCFLVYVVFSMHSLMDNYRRNVLQNAKQKMEQQIFDLPLFFTIVFFIIREGFEISLLIAATSIFAVFRSNIEGLILGFLLAAVVGIIASAGYSTLPIKKIFTYTEYGIIVVGAAMVKNGISLLIAFYTHIHLKDVIPLSLPFLPDNETVIGHALKNLIGIEQHMGVSQLAIMITYVVLINYIFRQLNSNKEITK
jgi:high-affinity iron transporter